MPPEPRPLVGVGAWVERACWRVIEQEAALLEVSFVHKLEACGAEVIVLPPQRRLPRVVYDLDGIVLVGGPDVGADRYGAQSSSEPTPSGWIRDESELALSRVALERDIPLLAICRGCQVFNVAAGGTLEQHVPDSYGGVAHRGFQEPEPFAFAEHDVVAEHPSVREILGDRFHVLSSHHQAVAELGDGLIPAARSSDGLIEAIVEPDKTFALGVQWHPEAHEESLLFEAFVAAARRYAADAHSVSISERSGAA